MSEQGYIVARLRARAVERRLRDINMIGEVNVAPIGSFFDWQAAEEIASLRAQLANMKDVLLDAREHVQGDIDDISPGWRAAKRLVERIDAALTSAQEKSDG